MTEEKFHSEAQTLKKFFELYCSAKHTNQKTNQKRLVFNNKTHHLEVTLCNECKELLRYSLDRLQECPHDIKPRCRTCPTPCYEKDKWKKVAKLMRYSGMQFGLTKIKKFFKLKNNNK